jgi:hypothetical protein
MLMVDRMTPRQQIFALVMSVALLVFVVEMVRRRRLREEYSWLWILVAMAILVLSAWFGLLKWLTNLIGAVTPVSTFFVFGILFLVVVNVYFSIKVSTLTTQVKNLAQRLAIMSCYLQELREGHSGHPADPANPCQQRRAEYRNAGRSTGSAGPQVAASGPEGGSPDQGKAKD